MKFLAMHITNQKLRFDIFINMNLSISRKFTKCNMIFTNNFGHKRKIYNFDSYNVFLAIAINIPQRLKTAFVLQGHKLNRFELYLV